MAIAQVLYFCVRKAVKITKFREEAITNRSIARARQLLAKKLFISGQEEQKNMSVARAWQLLKKLFYYCCEK